MARRNEHSLEEIKAMVLNAAESIIDEEGFAALTIRKIAMEMGYTVGSIYMVFASRSELILHINARTLEDIATHLQVICTTGDLETWIKAYLQYSRIHHNRWQMIFAGHSPQDESLPDWYQTRLNAVFQQFSAYFINTSADEQTIHALWQGIHGICLLSPKDELERSVLLLLGIFLKGLHS
jgi:AcrR family transcriptional regulator